MKMYDIIGYAIDGEIYCLDCAEDGNTDNDTDGASPIFAGDDSMNCPHCSSCGDSLFDECTCKTEDETEEA